MSPLTLGQAVRNAVEAERAAGRFYRRLLQGCADAEARTFFETMASQEDQHADSLEGVGRSLEDGTFAEMADVNVARIESAPEWERAESIDLAQALDIAIEAEYHAALFYDALADSAPWPVNDFFRELSAKEEQHAELLVAKKTNGG